jgi:hypothetical protein
MHLVHFNLGYGDNLYDALVNSKGSSDTLAAVSVLFKIQTQDNPDFDSLTQGEQQGRILG